MSIRDELRAELTGAMKAGDAPRRDVIRQIETEVSRMLAEPGFEGHADDGLYRTVIAAYVKKMTKARQEYLDLGERGLDMAKRLGFEVEYLARWLPAQLSADEVRDLVRRTIAELGVAGDESAMGRVMGAIMGEHRDHVDGSSVQALVREELAGG